AGAGDFASGTPPMSMEMDLLRHVWLKIGNYEGFQEAQGFEGIWPINVLIGRNNSGKSALLDLIQTVATRSSPSADHAQESNRSELVRGVGLEPALVDEIFQRALPSSIQAKSRDYLKAACAHGHVEWSTQPSRIPSYRDSTGQPGTIGINE